MAGDEGYETARVRVRRTLSETTHAEVEVSIGRSAGELAHAEVVIGHAPSEEAPPVALTRRGSPKLGRTRGDEVATRRPHLRRRLPHLRRPPPHRARPPAR